MTMNNAAINTHVQVFVESVFIALGHIPRSSSVGSYDKSL